MALAPLACLIDLCKLLFNRQKVDPVTHFEWQPPLLHKKAEMHDVKRNTKIKYLWGNK